jgi:hypothetical protein
VNVFHICMEDIRRNYRYCYVSNNGKDINHYLNDTKRIDVSMKALRRECLGSKRRIFLYRLGSE